MPLTSNVYHVGRGINTISRHDHRDHPSSRIDSCEPYPALRTLVEHSEGVSRDAEKLDEWCHSDALFGFAIAAHSDRVVRMGRIERDVVLNHILLMGIYDWKDTDCQECYKNSALFAQFLLSFLTYVLLSYFVRLHCANIHTPLPFLSYLSDHEDKASRSILCCP